MRLAARAPGKVNLCLFVGAPRADGLHPLVSVVQPVSLADELTLAPAEGAEDAVVCPGVEGENLALRALRAFRTATGWDGPPQTLTIAKRVPVAAGMGGGSADAAAALRLAAAAAATPIPDGLAMRLGADVPSQLRPARVLMAGAGERVAPLAAPAPFAVVLVPLAAALSTAAVYRAFDALGGRRSDTELAALEAAVREGEAPAVNDLQQAAISLCPQIAPALGDVRAAGAAHATVSGSGPTVYGLLANLDAAERAAARLRAGGHRRAVAAAPVGPEFAAVHPLPASE
jgi:4-diphosphocytidyl-2-C-methyl-D-erythritol kinase